MRQQQQQQQQPHAPPCYVPPSPPQGRGGGGGEGGGGAQAAVSGGGGGGAHSWVSEGVANSPYAQGPAASVIGARKSRPPVLDTSNDAALARALAEEIKARMLTYADACGRMQTRVFT